MDLNADLGESFGAWRIGADDALLKLVTSASVAARGVAVGAHVGYRDLAGFGRRHIAYQARELSDEVLYQITALDGMARTSGTAVSYVKPHGALYNTALDDPGQAGAVVAAVRAYNPDLAILCLPDSVLQRTATDAGLRAVRECFLDRAYTPAGRLIPRGTPGAVITDAEAVVARAVLMATEGVVAAADGTRVAVAPESMCVHGDTPTRCTWRAGYTPPCTPPGCRSPRSSHPPPPPRGGDRPWRPRWSPDGSGCCTPTRRPAATSSRAVSGRTRTRPPPEQRPAPWPVPDRPRSCPSRTRKAAGGGACTATTEPRPPSPPAASRKPTPATWTSTAFCGCCAGFRCGSGSGRQGARRRPGMGSDQAGTRRAGAGSA